MKNFIIISGLLFLSFFSEPNKLTKIDKLEGIWIPLDIEWEKILLPDEDSTVYQCFNAILFKNDTIAIISASNSKFEDDSIGFGTEHGFLLRKGKFKYETDSCIAFDYNIIDCRIIKLDTFDINKVYHDQIKIDRNTITYSGIDYVRGNLLTKESKNKIYNYLQF